MEANVRWSKLGIVDEAFNLLLQNEGNLYEMHVPAVNI